MIITRAATSKPSISIANGQWSVVDHRFLPPVILFSTLVLISAVYSTIICCGKKKRPPPRKTESEKQKTVSSTTGEDTGGTEKAEKSPQDPYEQRYRSRKTPFSKKAVKAIQSTVPYRLPHIKTIQQKVSPDDETHFGEADKFKKQTQFDLIQKVIPKLPKAIVANPVAQQTTAPKQVFRPAKEIVFEETDLCKTEFPTKEEATKKNFGKFAEGYAQLGAGKGGPDKHGTYMFPSNFMGPGAAADAGPMDYPIPKAAKISATKFEKLSPKNLVNPDLGPLKQPQNTAFPIVKYPKVVCVEEYGTMPAVPADALKATKVPKAEKVPANVYNTMAGINQKMKTSRKRFFFF